MTMEQKMDFLIEGMQELRGDVQQLKNCTQSLENGFQELQEKVGHLEGEVRGVRLHLENVTDANIMRVAEGDVRRMKEKLMMI